MHNYSERRQRLASQLLAHDVDGMLITNPKNVRYLTGFTGDTTYLLLGGRHMLMVSDGRYTRQLEEECPGVPLYIRPPGEKLTPAAAGQLKKLGWSKIACEAAHVTLSEFEVLRSELSAVAWKGLGDAVEQLRMIKDESEIATIKNAIGVAEGAFRGFISKLKNGDKEIDLYHRMEMMLRSEGAECGGFPAIIAIGDRSALPHAPPTSVSLDSQSLILIDWGARVDGYVSDLTRTCVIRSNVTSRLRSIYDAVLAAHEAAVATMKPGTHALEVDAAARKAIEEHGFLPYSHGLGHGIGLDVHESPQMRPGIEQPLMPGMVVTVEPGIYEPDWGGIRIEDDYLITNDGAQRLSTLPRDWESALLDV